MAINSWVYMATWKSRNNDYVLHLSQILNMQRMVYTLSNRRKFSLSSPHTFFNVHQQTYYLTLKSTK